MTPPSKRSRMLDLTRFGAAPNGEMDAGPSVTGAARLIKIVKKARGEK